MPPNKVPVFGKVLPGVVYHDRPGAYAFFFNPQSELAIIETPLGLFLPGGGVEEGETHKQALARELIEEIGWELISAKELRQSVQYHWSQFYQKHFKKVGTFYLAEARPMPGAAAHPDHKLRWMEPQMAERQLTQEFQRWAVRQGFAP
jgi:8-oxo-dGTP diphosphatase